MSFALDVKLAADVLAVGDMTLTRVLLMNDARWPWLILVPRRDGVVELTDLGAADLTQLIEEAALAAGFLKAHTGAHKINLGALGNIVRQLHLHVVARALGDPAWPGPVWAHGTARRYEGAEAAALIEAARTALKTG
jgi:diadenosine tetraphosphate (Ap4A) HIT family hydrolase